jgi:hypothetical protein
MHVQAFRDGVLRAGTEISPDEAGIEAVIELQLDFIGPPWKHPGAGTTCESMSANSEHGPDMCTSDRYHLCAQHPTGDINATAAGFAWLSYSFCLFQNIDVLKCGNNAHCAESSVFQSALTDHVHPMCAKFAGLNSTAIMNCAQSPLAIDMQTASFARSAAAALKTGGSFAPVFINGIKPAHGTDDAWRETVNATTWASVVLQAICDAVPGGSQPAGCAAPST